MAILSKWSLVQSSITANNYLFCIVCERERIAASKEEEKKES